MRKYQVFTDTYAANSTIDAENCNAIEFVNSGSDDATIDGRPLAAGESFSYYGLEGEIDTTRYKLNFTTTVSPLVLVIRKKYVGK